MTGQGQVLRQLGLEQGQAQPAWAQAQVRLWGQAGASTPQQRRSRMIMKLVSWII